MLIQDVMNFGARPALTEAMSFAAQRQRLIVHNIANLDTPNYQAKDVSVPAFQSALKKALDRRAETANGTDLGEFSMPETRDFVRDARGNMQLTPGRQGQHSLPRSQQPRSRAFDAGLGGKRLAVSFRRGCASSAG